MIVDVHSHVMQAGDDSLMAMNPVDISDASTDVDHSLPFRNSSVNNFDSLACISHGLVSVWFVLPSTVSKYIIGLIVVNT
jgi:hypothetical protein